MAHNNEVAIKIDKKPFKSPSPTTDGALYVLGAVDPNVYDLYREVHGHGDDEPMPNGNQAVELKNGDHFFSIKKKLNPGAQWA